jgi:hypothetical protein
MKNVLMKAIPVMIFFGILFLVVKTCNTIEQSEQNYEDFKKQQIAQQEESTPSQITDVAKHTIDTFYITRKKTVRDTVYFEDTLEIQYLRNQIYAMYEIEKTLKKQINRQTDSIALAYAERDNYEQLLKIEKENTAVLSNALRFPDLVPEKIPVRIKNRSLMFQIGHLGNFRGQNSATDAFSQMRFGIGYNHRLSNRFNWYVNMTFPLYSAEPKPEPYLFGINWGYNYNF